MTIQIQQATTHRTPVPLPKLRQVVRQAWRQIDGRTVDVTLRLTDHRELRRLNREFRQRDRTTDVLTFPYTTTAEHIAGDIVIAMERVVQQAVHRGIPKPHELVRLVVHGLAHLAGHHHAHHAAFRDMRRVEFPAVMAALHTLAL
jgi:probable rRNA maturation factor